MNDARPKYSLVIPTYDRPGQLRRCLQGIAALEGPEEAFEVVVVDDGSAQALDEVVDAFRAQLDVKLLRQENQGPATARNVGATAARGDYLVFIDDDCVPEPLWLTKIDQHLMLAPLAGVGGGARDRIGSLYTTAHQVLMDYLFSTLNADPEQAQFCATNNLCLPRKFFVEMEGFATSFRYAAGEDRELCDRWRAREHELHFLPDLLVDHYHALDLRSFLRLHYRYGRGARHYRQLSAQQDRAPVHVPAFQFGLVVSPFRRLPLPRAIGVFLLQVLSQFAHAIGYLHQSLSR